MKRRRIISLFNALLFLVMAATGIYAFLQPFSIKIIGLHSLSGFLFIAIVGGHILNNIVPLKKYFKHTAALGVSLLVVLTTALFYSQPTPIKAVLGLSGNLGPAQDMFKIENTGLTYQYSPDPGYKLLLDVRTGPSYDPKNPPHLAIWLENQSLYHIKTLFSSDDNDSREELPYWAFKVKGWKEAKKNAEGKKMAIGESVDAISAATVNGSFDPSDYILPKEQNSSMPYRLMLEINQPNDRSSKLDDQPSLVYEVEVDNFNPRTFQLLELVGYPIFDQEKDEWYLSYINQSIESALEIVDSSLLQIERSPESSL